MFSKEEARKMRQEFWIKFGQRSALLPTDDYRKKKWILFKTGIKDLSFKFEAERKFARVCIDFEQSNLSDRIAYWEKFESLKNIFTQNLGDDFIWDEAFVLDNGKEISRIYKQLDGVSLYNVNDWPKIFDFFIQNMTGIEELYVDFKDFVLDIHKED